MLQQFLLSEPKFRKRLKRLNLNPDGNALWYLDALLKTAKPRLSRLQTRDSTWIDFHNH